MNHHINLFFCLLTFVIFGSCESPKKPNTIADNFLIKDSYKKEIGHIVSYAKREGYNQKTAFMIDYGLHSGKNRFFVIDLVQEKITDEALVAHGTCKGDNKGALANTFSNTTNSYCTTLGMAVIAKRAYSRWGKNYKYWLDGLEPGNSNLRKRVVVLHGWEGIEDEQIYPKTLAMSWGCPTVSVNFLDELDGILKKEKKVLLYSFK